jgi:membrane associated rhomboid family serine protease
LFGLVPARFYPEFDVLALPSLLTNMFLHGGGMHLIANMWSLYLFGDNVEDRMGSTRFVIFYLVCGLVACLTHIAVNPGSPIPAIGASGAIAGVMGAYALMYPHAGIIILLPILFIPSFFEISAWFYFAFWFLVQFFSGAQQFLLSDSGTDTGAGIAFAAHVGGFVAGVALHRLFVCGDRHHPCHEPGEVPLEMPW